MKYILLSATCNLYQTLLTCAIMKFGLSHRWPFFYLWHDFYQCWSWYTLTYVIVSHKSLICTFFWLSTEISCTYCCHENVWSTTSLPQTTVYTKSCQCYYNKIWHSLPMAIFQYVPALLSLLVGIKFNQHYYCQKVFNLHPPPQISEYINCVQITYNNISLLPFFLLRPAIFIKVRQCCLQINYLQHC